MDSQPTKVTTEDENLTNVSSAGEVAQENWGGKREGAGRKKGSKNKATLEKKVAEKNMQRRIIRNTDVLLNAQINLARGESSLYRIFYTGKGKDRKKNIEIVTDQETIAAFLAEELDDTDDEYYYIATKSADSRSIDSLLDRAYGKARQSIDMTSDGEKIQPTTIIDLGNMPSVTDQSEAESSSDNDQE